MEFLALFAGVSLIATSVVLLLYGALNGKDIGTMVPEWLVGQVGNIITFLFMRGRNGNGDPK